MKRVFRFIFKRWAFLGFICLALFTQGSTPVKADSFFGVARPYFFSIARWEAQNVWKKWQYDLAGGRSIAGMPASEQVKTVQDYFGLVAHANDIRSRMTQHQRQGNPADSSGIADLTGQLQSINEKRAAVRPDVQAIIQRQISDAVRDAGINLQWSFPRFDIYFPPVDFELTPLPNVLLISPRDKIRVEDSLLLKAPLSAEQKDRIEAKAEKLGYAALVDDIGGVATYPAMVVDSSDIEFTITAAAHEWTHHYLFMRPLGRRYGDDYNMRTLNESTADIVGEEIGDKVLALYGITRQKEQPDRRASPRPDPNAFSFNREMRQIRLAVDDYLARGEVDQAEQFMRERQQFLASHGYYIRKLNQAYFAFHGSYSGGAASSSPIAGQLTQLRQNYPTLGEFARAVSGVSDYAEFSALIH